MILGVITVYKCDGDGCDAHKVVNDVDENDFGKLWFAGLDKHFCAHCRGQVCNAAAVADQERRLREIEQSVRQSVTTRRRPYVH